MSRRLGVWMRLGIVLTILWIVVGTATLVLWQFNVDYTVAEKSRDACLEINSRYPDQPQTDCWGEYQQLMDLDRSGVWVQALSLTAAAAVTGWLLFGIIYVAMRWILAGRRHSVDS